ncbi:hypothetical protein [Franconibacter helveticus]|uniref:hypothetical protein n=1 Tax=Franconibacter helveticus TaxID=357240 RepID=UPI00066D0036|nr:hypothetical protein [Franconibacter helveticus]
MKYAKLSSTLVFNNEKNDYFKYEIFQDFPSADYYAVISSKEDIQTAKYGVRPVWVEINSYFRLAPSNLAACEEECKAHFSNNY